MAVVSEPPWVNKTQGISERNGTATHAIPLGFTPTSGSFLMVVVGGAVTHTNALWAERVSPVHSGELSVFTRTSDGTETAFVDTTNGTNYGVVWTAYEFPAGTEWVGSTGTSTNSDAWRTITDLPDGVEHVVFAAIGRLSVHVGNVMSAIWAAPWVEDSAQTYSGNLGVLTDGYGVVVGHRSNVIASTATPDAVITYAGVWGELDRQIATWALDVAPVVPLDVPRVIRVAEMDALQLVQAARAQEWAIDYEIEAAAARGELPPRHFGPLAEELDRIDSRTVIHLPAEQGGVAVDTNTVAGLAWAAAAIAGDRIAALTTRVAELERQLAELT